MTDPATREAAPAPHPIAHPGARDYALLVLLAALWGGSFLLIKLAVATVPPLTVAAGRTLVGALLMGAVLAMRGVRPPSDGRTWAKLALMGTVGTVLPFALISWGERHIDSGLAAILMSAVPLFTIVLAHMLRSDEKITIGKAAALVLGGVGVVVLVGPDVLRGIGGDLLGQLAVLLAALCYAVNGLTARTLTGQPAIVVAAGMLITAAMAGVPLALLIDRPWETEASALSLLAVVALGVLPTALGYLIALRIIASAGAGFASLNNYLVPVFGVFWGMVFLAEKLHPQALLALLLIFLGLAAPRLIPSRGNGMRGADRRP
ncbi:MAG TPA: DMT family transporter [Alphaproteobacteria bacterium]|nr:DMT family transporter [Alphaproteobacteria bacterium]